MSPTLPGYEILTLLAIKGNIVVCKARNLQFNRVVAVKAICPHATDEVRHFQREIRFVAMLRHPNIVKAFDADCSEGQYFLVMEYVEGGDLGAKVGRPWPARDAANLMVKLADALHAVHEQGLIHRRVEPSHILLTTDGDPRLTGFRFGLLAEEAAKRDIKPAADICDLGAVFYQVLSGRPVRAEQPDPALEVGVPKELETICLKCIRNEYVSAKVLGDDLRRFIKDRVKRGWRWFFGG